MTRSLFLPTALLALRAAAQTASPYTDSKSGIKFNGFSTDGYTVGIALPEKPTTDLIAQIITPVNSTGGWGGFSMGSSMAGNLLVVAWPNNGEIVSSFRLATGYSSPNVTTGEFSMTTIPAGTYTNATAFSYTFLCSNCISSNDTKSGIVLSDTANVLGYAFSSSAVANPASSSSALTYHSAGFGEFGFTVADAESADFATWAALATGGSNSTSNSTSSAGTEATSSAAALPTVAASSSAVQQPGGPMQTGSIPAQTASFTFRPSAPIQTGTPSAPTSAPQGQQSGQSGHHGGGHHHSHHHGNGNGGAQPTGQPVSSFASTPAARATPQSFHQRRHRAHKKRQLVGRLPYGPEYADRDAEIAERSQMERASFLDSAYEKY